MAYNHNPNDGNYLRPLESILFKEGFTNDVTPLDEYNLNLILKAILWNNDNMRNVTSQHKNENTTAHNDLQANITTVKQNLKDDIKNLDNALNMLADKSLVESRPTINITTTPVDEYYEVGTTIATLGWSVKYTDGTYKYCSEEGPTSKNAGCVPIELTVTLTSDSQDKYNKTMTYTTGFSTESDSFEDIIISNDSDLTLTAVCKYRGGYIPLNNIGRPNADEAISESTCRSSKELKRYRQIFCASKSARDKYSYDDITSATIRGWADTDKKNHIHSSVDSFNVEIEENTRQVLIAVPSTRRITKIEDTEAFNTDISSEFTVVTGTSGVSVGGADATIDDNGEYVIGEYTTSYDVYVYEPDANLSSNTYKVTLTNKN